MSFISVIIPTFNRAMVLRRAVDSVLAQRDADFELIVVDDGSTDDTEAVVSQYGNKVRMIRQTNRGVSSARNRGIAEASGRLIAFLDSDDEWLPGKLSAQQERFDPRRPLFICHTDEVWIRDGKPLGQKPYHRKQGGRFFERALERCLISPSSVMISRDLLDGVGMFDETLPAAEDYDLWLRITAFHSVEFLATPLIVKHGGAPDQLSSTVPAIDRFRVKAITKILDHPELSPEYVAAAVDRLVTKCRILAAGSRKRGRESEALDYEAISDRYLRRFGFDRAHRHE